MNDLAQRMSAWRSHRGLTLQEVADSCGLTKQKISYVELGDQDIGVEKLSLICDKAFRTTLVTFFGPIPAMNASAKPLSAAPVRLAV